MCQNTDSPAIVQVAERRGVHACGWDSDMAKYGPNAQLAANTQKPGARTTIDEVQKVIGGTWTGNRQTLGGLKEKMVIVQSVNKSVPADVVRQFEERKQAIIDGKLHPFRRPAQGQHGARSRCPPAPP